MSVVEVGVRDRERVGMSHAVKSFAEVGHTVFRGGGGGARLVYLPTCCGCMTS